MLNVVGNKMTKLLKLRKFTYVNNKIYNNELQKRYMNNKGLNLNIGDITIDTNFNIFKKAILQKTSYDAVKTSKL